MGGRWYDIAGGRSRLPPQLFGYLPLERAEREYSLVKLLVILKLPPALHTIETSNVCSIR